MTRSSSLTRQVAVLAWPAVLQGLLETIVFLVDRLMLGRYSADALASMQISGPILWSVLSISTAFTAGTIAVVGRAVGAKDGDRAKEATTVVLLFAVVLGAIVGAAGLLGRPLFSELLAGGPQTSQVIRDQAEVYMGIMFPAGPFFFAGLVGISALQASGDTRTPLLVALFAGAANVLGNYILIFGHFGAPEMGVAGAAWASALSFGAQGVVIVVVLWRRREGARLRFARLGLAHRDALRSILKISVAAFGEKIIFHTGFLVFVALIGRLGDTAMAANQILIAIESLGFITADGFGIAAGAIVAQKLGARLPGEARRAGFISMGLGVGTLTFVSILFVLAPGLLVGMFSPDEEIVTLGVQCLYIAAAAQPLMAIASTFAAALRGAGDTRSPMLVALAGPLVVRISATWFFAFGLEWGLVGVWIGSTCDWLVRSVALAWVFHRGRWMKVDI